MKGLKIEILIIILLGVIVFVGWETDLFPGWPGETAEQPQKPVETSEELSFEERVKKLDSTQKLTDYLNEYYTFEEREGETYAPKEFFKKNKGEVQDYAVFAAHVLDTHGYETLLVPYKYGEDSFGAITVFRTKKKANYLSFSEGKVEIYEAGTSFEQTLESEEKRLGAKIKSYKILTPGPDLTREEWVSK